MAKTTLQNENLKTLGLLTHPLAWGIFKKNFDMLGLFARISSCVRYKYLQ